MKQQDFDKGDLIEFYEPEQQRVYRGQLMFVLENATETTPRKWMVMCVTDSGRSMHHRKYEDEMRLFNKRDYDPRLVVAFVVWDALESGKKW